MTAAHDPHALELARGFVVATGIECSAPVARGGRRFDELVKTGHWEHYAEDYALIAGFGMRYVRFGIPFHVVARGPRVRDWDWRWTDRALEALREAGLEPILDLLHFGLPDDIPGVTDRRLVDRFELYAEEVVRRYPWARYYTPVNEPLVLATFSTQAGLWYERTRTDEALVAALDALVTCAVRGMQVIRRQRPDAIFIQSDACEGYQAAAPDATAERHARFLNERRFVAFDLTYGRKPSLEVVDWLMRNGLGADRLDWFAANGTTEGCIVGHDYYRGNEWLVDAHGATSRAGRRRRGYLELATEYHARYDMPFMLSETNIAGKLASGWLAEMWNAVLEMRTSGLPVRGFCWYGFVDHVDWDSALTIERGKVNTCGLVGIDRRPHRVGIAYRGIAQAALAGIFAPLPVRPRRERAVDQPLAA